MKILSTVLFMLFCLTSCKVNKTIIKHSSSIAVNHDTLAVRGHYQKTVADTLSYVQNIKINKERYKNKELGALINDLNIEIESYSILGSRIGEYYGLMLYFDDLKTTFSKMDFEENAKKPAILSVRFQTSLPISKYNEISAKSTSKGEWQKAEQNFYSKVIIIDIN